MKSLSPEAQKGIRSIGVISALGDQLLMQNVPYFASDQEEYAHPIPSWGLDDHVASKLAQQLGARYTVSLFSMIERLSMTGPRTTSTIRCGRCQRARTSMPISWS